MPEFPSLSSAFQPLLRKAKSQSFQPNPNAAARTVKLGIPTALQDFPEHLRQELQAPEFQARLAEGKYKPVGQPVQTIPLKQAQAKHGISPTSSDSFGAEKSEMGDSGILSPVATKFELQLQGSKIEKLTMPPGVADTNPELLPNNSSNKKGRAGTFPKLSPQKLFRTATALGENGSKLSSVLGKFLPKGGKTTVSTTPSPALSTTEFHPLDRTVSIPKEATVPNITAPIERHIISPAKLEEMLAGEPHIRSQSRVSQTSTVSRKRPLSQISGNEQRPSVDTPAANKRQASVVSAHTFGRPTHRDSSSHYGQFLQAENVSPHQSAPSNGSEKSFLSKASSGFFDAVPPGMEHVVTGPPVPTPRKAGRTKLPPKLLKFKFPSGPETVNPSQLRSIPGRSGVQVNHERIPSENLKADAEKYGWNNFSTVGGRNNRRYNRPPSPGSQVDNPGGIDPTIATYMKTHNLPL